MFRTTCLVHRLLYKSTFVQRYFAHRGFMNIHWTLSVQVPMAAEITATTLHHGLPFGFSWGQFSGKGTLAFWWVSFNNNLPASPITMSLIYKFMLWFFWMFEKNINWGRSRLIIFFLHVLWIFLRRWVKQPRVTIPTWRSSSWRTMFGTFSMTDTNVLL